MLAVKFGKFVNLTIQSQTHHSRKSYGFFIGHRQSPGLTGYHFVYIGIRHCFVRIICSRRKHFGFGIKLDVNFKPNYRIIFS